MEDIPLKKKDKNRRIKHKLKNKNKENLSQEIFKPKIIFKSIIIFIFILFIIICLFSFEIINSLLFNENEAFKEILSFEKKYKFI